MTYKNFDKSYRRGTYSKLLRLDENEEVVTQRVNEIYKTKYKNSKNFLNMMNLTLEELNSSQDPLIIFIKDTFELKARLENIKVSNNRFLLYIMYL